MFSLPKLLVLAVIILAVWYGFKLMSRLNGPGGASNRRAGDRTDRRIEAKDLVHCRTCDRYVPAVDSIECERTDCPRPDQRHE